MSLVCLLLLSLCLLLLLQLVWNKRQRILLGWSLAGPWAVPGLGNVQMIGNLRPENIFLIFTEMRVRFGATYRLWLGPQLWIFLHSAEETRDALHNSTLRKAATFQQLSPLIGNGLLISHGRDWAAQRRLLTPCFQTQLLRSFAPAANKHANRLLNKLLQTKATGIEVTDYLFACLLDTIVDTSMGYQLETQLQDENSPLVRAFHRSGELMFKRMINPLLAFDFVFKRTRLWREFCVELNLIHQHMDQIIEQRQMQLKMQEEAEEQAGKNKILLDAMLLAGLDRQQIRDQVNTFVFAGVDTTTAAMNFVLYALAKYPEIQEKLHGELKDFTTVDNWDANWDDLVYLDAVLKEVLRLYTIVPSTGRQTTQDTTIGGRRYCAGVTIWINMYGLAHDARYFPEPYAFRPERWLQKDMETTAYSYIPYSSGAHVCIGRRYSLLLMKLLTVRIVQSFKLELKDPQAQLVLQAQMVLRSRDGIHIKFIPR